MVTTLMTSLIGIFVFPVLMIAAYRYANGRWKVAENKRDDYQNWTENQEKE
ncbi:MAG: hypothetical protein ACK4ND_18125 [Cytophagaceae bacterium]